MEVGEILWKVPPGEYKALTAMGIPPTGTENFGGLVATAGGLIFVGATIDAKFRAFDKMVSCYVPNGSARLGVTRDL